MEFNPDFFQNDFKSGGLHPVRSGDRLNQGRYEIKFPHPYASVRADDEGHVTYVAKDTETSTFVCLRTFRAMTSPSDPATHDTETLKEISSKEASDRLLIPTDSFWLRGLGGKHLMLAYELFGPDIGSLEENGPWNGVFPVNVVQKVIVDALEAVEFLHKHGVCHGAVGTFSLVFTYPDLDSRDDSQLASIFLHPTEQGYFAVDSQNGNLIGASGGSNNINFKIKLQNFSKTFPANHAPLDTKRYIHGSLCPPRELAFNEPIGAPTDIWYLALTLAVLTSPFPCPGPLELNRVHSPHDAILDLRDILGDFPPRYKHQLENAEAESESAHEDLEYDSNKLRDILLGTRLHGTSVNIDMGGKMRNEEDMDAWVGVLKGMLRWAPDERGSAGKVLGGELLRKFSRKKVNRDMGS